MREKLKFYLNMIGHILSDGVFLIVWSGVIYSMHTVILPRFQLEGIMEIMVNGVAIVMDVSVCIPVIVRLAKEMWNTVKGVLKDN